MRWVRDGRAVREQYDTLSKIAPTVAWPSTGTKAGTPWQEQTLPRWPDPLHTL